MAQAILLADVEGLGENGTAVEVSSGYLRNFLAPRGLAQPATPGALEEAIRRKEQAEKAERSEERFSRNAETDLSTAPSPPRRSPRRSVMPVPSRSIAARSASMPRSTRSAPT